MNDQAAHIFVSGEVQGVGFRNFAQRVATRLGLRGYARNLQDGRVEIEAEGEREKIEALIQSLRQGAPRSRVAAVSVSWKAPTGGFSSFSITF